MKYIPEIRDAYESQRKDMLALYEKGNWWDPLHWYRDLLTHREQTVDELRTNKLNHIRDDIANPGDKITKKELEDVLYGRKEPSF